MWHVPQGRGHVMGRGTRYKEPCGGVQGTCTHATRHMAHGGEEGRAAKVGEGSWVKKHEMCPPKTHLWAKPKKHAHHVCLGQGVRGKSPFNIQRRGVNHSLKIM